jgi:hypothetical protein
MGQVPAAPRWVPVSREVFEYEMIPWVGRTYAPWLRAAARPHPADEHRLVLIPERILNAFQERGSEPSVTPAQLEAMGYPRLPDEDELEAARAEQRLAALSGDERRIAELHQRVEQLERQVEAARRAVDEWRRADPTALETSIALELAMAPHSSVHVGIPAEADHA